MLNHTYALKIGYITKVAKMENGKIVLDENKEPIMVDKFVPENVITTRTGLMVNEATLEPESVLVGGVMASLFSHAGKSFILFDVDQQKEVKSGIL